MSGLTLHHRLSADPVYPRESAVRLDRVRPLMPYVLVQLETLGDVLWGCALREDGGEGGCVFDCLPGALGLVCLW
jgi:hypothetical protein